MAGVYKRGKDRDRGKDGRWTFWWIDEHGKKRSKVGTTDRAKSLEMGRRRETEAALVREGVVDAGERRQREASLKPVAAHIDDYERDLLARDDEPKHARQVASTLKRLLADASVASVADIAPDRIREALGRLRVTRSPRTCNHALGAVKAFAKWLEHSNRIKEVPRGLAALKPYSEEVDRKRVRRALTEAELAKLLAATEAGPAEYIYGHTKSKHHRVAITGPQRAALYRLAMGTGFRADELRTLAPEAFALEGDEPSVTVEAAYSKNKRRTVQPITRELATALRPFVAGREPGKPVLVVPDRTAEILRRDLGRAEIPYKVNGKVVDFHALRHTYITHLIQSGENPKIVQILARHSTITLTLDRYTHLEAGDTRKAIERRSTSAESDGPARH